MRSTSVLLFSLCCVGMVSAGCASTRITDLDPEPVHAGQPMSVELEGVIGPSFLEPGVELEFDGTVMLLSPDTSTEVGFTVPGATATGPHKVSVRDRIGFIEAILIVPLFKDRTDSVMLQVIGATPRDIKLEHFEITQGLQRDANDIPLVKGKPTVIRAFPVVADGGADITGVTGKLHALRGGAELPGSPINPDNGPIGVSSTFTRLEPNDSLNFTLDPDWYDQVTDFWVEVILPAGLVDPNLSDNRFPAAPANYTATYNNRDGLSIQYVRVTYDNPSWTGATTPRGHVADSATCDWMRAIYPADPLEMPYDAWVPDTMTFTQTTGTSLNASALITELNTMYLVATSPADRLYGWTPEDTISFNGISDPIWAGGLNNVACGNDTEGGSPPLTSRYRRTFAHEMGHNTDAGGLFHTSRRLMNDEYGYDVLGVDPFSRVVMRQYPSTDPNPTLDLFDFMRGGELEPHAWIAPPHYDYLYNWMVPGFAADAMPVAASAVADAEEYLVCRGAVTRDGGGSFFPFYRISPTDNARRSEVGARTTGSHTVVFLDALGGVLRSIAWTPDFRSDDSEEDLAERPFTWILPPVAGAKRVELRVGEAAVDSFDIKAAAPNVSEIMVEAPAAIDAPAAATTAMATVSWSSRTPDALEGTATGLVYQVYFSRDQGETWNLVRSGLTAPTAEIDLSSLPGGDRCVLRVSSSDGYNATSSTSQPFAVADKAPKSTILAPRSGRTRLEGGGVLLVGRSYDLEDSDLSSGSLTWFSDLQGELGNGRKIVVRDLRVGRHSITLKGRDSAGNESVSKAIVVTIVER